VRRYFPLLVIFILGAAYTFVSPPFHVPDEVGHYWRACALSRGEIFLSVRDAKTGGEIAEASRDLVAALSLDIAGNLEAKIPRERFARAAALRDNGRTVWVKFPAPYTPVPQLPQVLALLIARVLSIPTLAAFYLARIFNLLAIVVLIGVASRMAPELAPIFYVVACLPMALFIEGSLSADGITIAIAFCAIAATRRAFAIPVAGVLALCKPAYFFLPFIRRKFVLPMMATTIAGLVIAGAQARVGRAPRFDAAIDPGAQLRYVMTHPFAFLWIAIRDYAHQWRAYWRMTIGQLGWLDVALPWWLIIVFTALLVFVAASIEKSDRATRVASAIAFVATCFVISLTQYAGWTPLAAQTIDGIQGRYFLPALPALLIAIGGFAPRLARYRDEVLWSVVICGNVVAILALANRYYQP
jgi:uncharacterized membrane protein